MKGIRKALSKPRVLPRARENSGALGSRNDTVLRWQQGLRERAAVVEPLAIDDGYAGDRRGAPRQLSILRICLLQINGQRDLGLVKNVSASGLMVRSFCQLDAGQRLGVEIKPGQLLEATVCWTRGTTAGLAFATAVDVDNLLASRGAAEDHFRPRLPRVAVSAQLKVRAGSQVNAAELCDISLRGVKIVLYAEVSERTEVVLMLPYLPPLLGTVRWTDAHVAGVALHEALSFETLAPWVANQRRISATSPR